ncbi:unnamed protein product [Chilo suppressalis]|uniref:Snurportin-1 n=1 Tax=Chilo suppressalis TaxID=168631 RepID=A0ABN8BA03_CHISP|nr:unnamed protein product [Chilo suppressalis]
MSLSVSVCCLPAALSLCCYFFIFLHFYQGKTQIEVRMEEVLEKMESVLGSLKPKDSLSSFEGLYKNWGKLDNQEERRRDLLEIQKSNRNAKLDLFRGILDLVNTVEENDIFKSSKKVHYRPSIYVAGFNRASPAYNNVLMMSEWLIEKPSDFAENWYITPCPKGTRVLVVANNGITKCYTKYGQFLFKMNSALPGGNRNYPKSNKGTCCVLDCFYCETKSTLYVLDLLAWNNQPMTDCDTEFRYFWLQSQFAENPEVGVINKQNKIKFTLLPKSPCKPDELNKFMMTYPHFESNSPSLDGILFYHRQAHYISGETPLVGWLFPYMVPEVLGADITVNKSYMSQKPEGYVNQADFIRNFEEKQAKKKHGRRSSRNSNAMDTADINKTEMEAEESTEYSVVAVVAESKTTMETEETLREKENIIENIKYSLVTESTTSMESEESTKEKEQSTEDKK